MNTNEITLIKCTEDELLKLDEEYLLFKSKEFSRIETDLQIFHDALQSLNTQNQIFDKQIQLVQSNIQQTSQNVSQGNNELDTASSIHNTYKNRKFRIGFLIGASACLLLSPPVTLSSIIGTTVVSGITGYLFT
jgi:hypothetical protein